MRLMLRPEWRLWPFCSFLGLLDLKSGVVIVLLFALLNKVAGVYGLIAVLTGAGGSFSQLSLYLYSALGLVALGWGIKVVRDEDARKTLYLAHLFFADHVFSSAWTIYFAYAWWFLNPHDGARQANSKAQLEIIAVANVANAPVLTDAERAHEAMNIWNHEKGSALGIILLSWLAKIYFAALVYSYARHLRKGSYHALPHSRYAVTPSTNRAFDPSLGEDDEEVEDFYRLPLHHTHLATTTAENAFKKPQTKQMEVDQDEVLFDEDELAYSFSSRVHSKMGTDDSSSSTTDDERRLSRSRV